MPLNPRIEHWTGRVVWLVGASTGIGRATAARLHAAGARVIVSARKKEALDAFVAEHAGAEAIALDATDEAAMRAAVAQIVERHGRIDLAGYFAGMYTPMRAQAFDLASAKAHMAVNYTGALVMLDVLLPQLLRQARAAGGGRGGKGQGDGTAGGHISLVSSVAGFRGLPKSLAYGPTKAALINLAETLYLDLSPEGVGISVINPGFVETPLTAGNDFHMPALITPEQAAEAILRGWQAGDFEIHFPKRFTLFLKGLRHLGYGAYFAAVRRSTGL
jgi:NAD(P)-dependent dehydrogenase (short-subunit alcohol dehydrogenase family)